LWHCCHCRWCQRETGSAFVLNAIVETSKLDVTGDTGDGGHAVRQRQGQKVVRCPQCHVAL